jgi:hypothetical protein
VCDWCLSDDGIFGGKQQQQAAAGGSRSEQPQPFTGFGKGGVASKATGGVHDGGRRARRYKLLKDVLC